MAKKDTSTPDVAKAHPEAKGLLTLACVLICFLSLVSFTFKNPSANWLGMTGYGIGWLFSYLFGVSAYFVLAFTGWVGWKLLLEGKVENLGMKIFYFSILLLSFSILINVLTEKGMPLPGGVKHKVITESTFLKLPYPRKVIRHNLGGVPFYYLYRDLPSFNLQTILSDVGTLITFSITSIVSFFLLTGLPFSIFAQKVASYTSSLAKKPLFSSPDEIEKSLIMPNPIKEKSDMRIRVASETEDKIKHDPLQKRNNALNAQRVYNGDFTTYQIPPPSLLTNPKKVDHPSLKKELKKKADILEESLMSFGIEAKVGEINCGPTITSFEVHPAVGVKVQRITALDNDLALNLQAKSLRIIAPIPGKAAVGVEIPSPYPQEVSFKELLLNYQQSPRKHHIPILLGKTVSGEHLITDLAKMPHCLIAGATGSGKSVCINTIVMSIVMNARPDEIKLIMVDPKKVELTQYTNLPHMIAPVITEAHGAYAALNWLVKEMQIRYDILKQLGLRNISAFNSRVINKEFESALNIPVPERMYAIVGIIDEFADLMMASSSDLETPIARIAQMARAVGIHLILATQRPSREVITGLIKANFPTRIAFKVASRVNSQIILDENGAESLLGNGDMLFLPPGSSHLMRAQGAYISDEDMNQVRSFITTQAPPHYLIPSFDRMSIGENSDESSNAKDSLYDEARQIVIDTKNASTTFLQRKLKIGYARAASLMDELEARGVISPQEGSKPRRVLVEEKDLDRSSAD